MSKCKYGVLLRTLALCFLVFVATGFARPNDQAELVLLRSPLQAQEFRLSEGKWTTVENFVQMIFFLTHSSGSLTLSGTCKATQQGNVVVSDTLSNPPPGPFRDFSEAMTTLSQRDPRVSWVRDNDGYMRVSDNRVIGDVLHIHLKQVHFRSAVDPDAAIRDVLSAPEVRAYLKEKHIEEGTGFNNIVPTSTKGFPRLAGDLRDVTVAQALDRIVKFFPGLWTYSECTTDSFRRVTIRGAEVGWPAESPAGGQAEPH
jgi:hypothetical protein